ncbi:MAG: NADH:ubiquinone reductase (Na(+)-transporting) subunit B [Bacteroidetes bacterium]|nr:MAG: NADH:ubiquinone reductase (Na(+)-transporting) subunit B [Bacteroidota bacterium]
MGLRSALDKIKPNFLPGGRFSYLHSTFDAFETFLFTPDTVTQHGSHIRDAVDLKRTMIMVVIALMPALVFGWYNIGLQHALMLGEPAEVWPCIWYGFLQMLPAIVVSYVVALGIEFGVAQVRGHEVNEGVLVTGILVPMIIPIDLPLWMLALAVAFAIVFGKEIFGGTGMNIFNPALLTRAFLFFGFPAYMSGDSVWVAGMGDAEHVVDGFSGATPLSYAAAGLEDKLPSVMEMFVGTIPGSVGETSTLAILLGALLLLITGVASYRIMLSVFVGGLLTGMLFNAIGANAYMDLPACYHLLMGGFAFGAVFMATDPVSASQTNAGKWIYGFLIGVFTVMVRVINPAYPEGMMLSILLMNAFAPLIDYLVVGQNIKARRKRAAAAERARVASQSAE